MEQQPARPKWLVVPDVALVVWRDVHIIQPDLAILHARVALAQVHLACPDRFDLGASQGDAGFERLQDLVVVERLAIGREDALRRPLGRRHFARAVLLCRGALLGHAAPLYWNYPSRR